MTSDSFTYRAQDTSGLSDIVTVKLDLTGSAAVNGTRYKGTRYHGTRYKGTRYHGTRYKGTRYKGTRYKSLNDAAMITYGECGPRWVWVNPQITFYEQTTAEITAALYSATGARIAPAKGSSPTASSTATCPIRSNVAWPVWNTPRRPAGSTRRSSCCRPGRPRPRELHARQHGRLPDMTRATAARTFRLAGCVVIAIACLASVAGAASAYTILERVSGGNYLTGNPTPTGNAAQAASFAESSIDGTTAVLRHQGVPRER